MALINCPYCNEIISDKATTCPHCNAQLTPVAPARKCEECGTDLPENATVCPRCGFPVHSMVPSPVPVPTPSGTQNTYKLPPILKPIIIILVILAVFGSILYVNNNYVITGDDKLAYELILNVAHNFKNPSSVRLVSGTLGVDKDCIFCGISATNGFGARGTSYYYIDKKGYVIEEEDNIYSFYKDTNKLNIKKINKFLARKLGSE